MATSISRSILTASVGALASTAAFGQVVLITDNFETDSSADYTVINSSVAPAADDGADDFVFDYVAAGIPLAPRSTAGDTVGLKLEANITLGASDARTAFHNTIVDADRYKMTVDVWMNFAGASGSTEYGNVGVGGDGATFNQVFLPISGSGAFITFTGDGGSGSSDYRWFRAPANSPFGDAANTTLSNDHPSYLGHGSRNTDPFFAALFPSPPATIAGSPGNIWTTIEIEVDNVAGVISFRFDGTLTYRGNFAGRFDGLVSLGLADAFSSVSASNNFTLYDNLEVETVPALGMSYCAVVANSTGLPANLVASGSDQVLDNDFTLTCLDMPLNAFGFFLASPAQDFMANPGGSMGNLCLGAFGRGVGGAIVNTDGAGFMSLQADLSLIPLATGATFVLPGETLNFQTWFRDSVGGMLTSNLSNGLEVMFL